MGQLLETAKYWQRFGIATIPIEWKSKQPKVRWLPYTERMPTENEMQNWFANDLVNIGIIAGWQNLCIVDFDDMDVFYKWYTWSIDTGGKAKQIATQSRIHQSARGAHVYILCENADNMKLPKIDILAHRKYALLPPSLHPTGVNYTVYRDALPMPVKSLYDILPAKLLDDAQKAKTTNPAPPTTLSKPIPTMVYDPWAVAGKDPENENLIQAIKEQIKITDIMTGWIESDYNGRWLINKCPFHDDRNPSFWLDTEHQVCGCHAGCTPLPLDVINLYARLYGIDNITAIKELAQRLH